MPGLFAILDLGMAELIVIGAVGVLLFGKNLPEVGRSFGKQLGQLRKGFSSIENEVRSATEGLNLPILPGGSKISKALSALDSFTQNSSPPSTETPSSWSMEEASDLEEPTAPKFEPPPAP